MYVCLLEELCTSQTIISLGMDFRALADNTLRCLMNYYRDGGDCKGIVHFLF